MSNFGPQGFARSQEQVIAHAKKRGWCPKCSQPTHGAEGNFLTRKMVPLDEVKDKNGAVVVYKGYCVQPTCNTLNSVKKILGESLPRERRRRNPVQDTQTGQIVDVARQRGGLAQSHLSRGTSSQETGSILMDDDSSPHHRTGFQSNLRSSSDLESGSFISPDNSCSSSQHASGIIPGQDFPSESISSTSHLGERDNKSTSQGDCSHSCSHESTIASRSTISSNVSQASQEAENA